MQGIVWEGDGEGGGWERVAARGRRAEALGASRGRRAEVGDQSESEEGGGTGGPVAASARPPTTGRRCAMRGGHKAQTAPTERRHSTGSGHAALQGCGGRMKKRVPRSSTISSFALHRFDRLREPGAASARPPTMGTRRVHFRREKRVSRSSTGGCG